jgi:polysaccharide export outer membrane protein
MTAVLLLLLLGVCTVPSLAAPMPSDEQLELLRQLPAAQQQELLRSLSLGKSAPKAAEPIEQPEVVKAPEQAMPIMPVPEESTAELKPFGYDLFAGTPTTFAPVTEIPVPVNYVIGPGDTVQVQLFGKESAEYELQVNREGILQFPGIGPIAVTGMKFDELKSNLLHRIAKQMIGVEAHISLGTLRSMRVFVMGDVNRPGSYMVSALSTMTNALFVSGGVRPIGSLRDIQLKRSGKVVQHLDLYRLLLQGDTSSDARIQPGDVIFVPPVGDTVGIAGEVRRPAIYELRGEKTVGELLALAGGPLPTAYQTAAQLERISAAGERTLLSLDLSATAGQQQTLENGDTLRVASVLDQLEDVVMLDGHVQRPGGVQWRSGMRLSDVIPSIHDLLPEPNLRFALVRREAQPQRDIAVLMPRLDAVFADPASAHNIELQPRDEITVFGLSDTAMAERDKILSSLIRELYQQASFAAPEKVVSIFGNVRLPGIYPLPKDMQLQDLLRVAGDMMPESDPHYVLLIRQDLSSNLLSARSFDLTDRATLQASLEYALQPRDAVYVFHEQARRSDLLAEVLVRFKDQAASKQPAALVHVNGLVRSPGKYPLEAGMTVKDLLRAAGGLTEAAYDLEAELSRYHADRLGERDVWHLPVKLEQLLAGNIQANLTLRAYDTLHIKQVPNWRENQYVEVGGEVRFPGRYPVQRGETLSQLLERAGGLTVQAFAEGAVLLRESLRRKEQEQLDTMAARLESDLATVSLEQQQAGGEQQYSVGLANALLKQLRSTRAMGRLVIDLPALLAAGDEVSTEQDIVVRDGDKLFIPTLTQEVTIIGEVQHSTSHLFHQDLEVEDYIRKSGGVTYRADEDRIYVVRANGAVLPTRGSEWFSGEAGVRPGDTIVVPLDAERMQPLALWTNISQIIYQLGIAAASWNVVGLF